MDFFPRSPKFFDLLENIASKTQQSGQILYKSKTDKRSLKLQTIKAQKLEKSADNICHNLYHEADMTFITPIDREDIHLLSKNLDNIIDLVENLISNVHLYRIKKLTKEFKEFSLIIKSATNEVYLLIENLRGKEKKIVDMRKIIIRIHTLENKGDILLRKSLQGLFSNHEPPIFVIIWKDLYENMEAVLDECEDTADIVDEIIVKNF